MIKLRLRRMGAKRQPSYRIVAADVRSPRDGRFIEIIGNYNPQTDPYTLQVNEERAIAAGEGRSYPAAKLRVEWRRCQDSYRRGVTATRPSFSNARSGAGYLMW